MAEPKPVTQPVRFVQWGTVQALTGPILTMTVTSDTKEKTPLTVVVPIKKENGAAEPPADAKTLSGQLRVGDELQLTYVPTVPDPRYCSAKAGATGDPKRDESTVFTFSARRTVPFRGKQVEAVFVTRGAMVLAFLLPDADPKDDAYQPDPGLLKKLRDLRRGNTVRLTYDPADFAFWLRDIEAVKPAADKQVQGTTAAPATAAK